MMNMSMKPETFGSLLGDCAIVLGACAVVYTALWQDRPELDHASGVQIPVRFRMIRMCAFRDKYNATTTTWHFADQNAVCCILGLLLLDAMRSSCWNVCYISCVKKTFSSMRSDPVVLNLKVRRTYAGSRCALIDTSTCLWDHRIPILYTGKSLTTACCCYQHMWLHTFSPCAIPKICEFDNQNHDPVCTFATCHEQYSCPVSELAYRGRHEQSGALPTCCDIRFRYNGVVQLSIWNHRVPCVGRYVSYSNTQAEWYFLNTHAIANVMMSTELNKTAIALLIRMVNLMIHIVTVALLTLRPTFHA
jgi:hypothetical protein